MAFPARKRGLRSITVNETAFRWRFSPGEQESALVVYGAVATHQSLLVHLRGWADMWLAFPGPTHNEPTSITPDFVRRAIQFALARGWAPATKAKNFEIEWRDQEFHLVAEPAPVQPDESRSTSSA